MSPVLSISIAREPRNPCAAGLIHLHNASVTVL